MTVSQLRKSLKGIDGKLEVYTRDHDHSEYETNSVARLVKVVDQRKMSEWDKKHLDEIFIRKDKYVIVSA